MTVRDGGRSAPFVLGWTGATIPESYQDRALERAPTAPLIRTFPGLSIEVICLHFMILDPSRPAQPNSRPALSARQNARLRSNLTQALETRGMSGRELAAAARLGPHFVSDIGKNGGPSLAALLRIVEVLGLSSIDELLGPSGTSQFIALGQTHSKNLSSAAPDQGPAATLP